MKPASMMTQNMINPLGLECKTPCFSYLLSLENRGDKQTAYQILAASRKTLLEEGKADLWNSGKVLLEQNYGLVYEGSPLSSRQEVFWKVRVWDSQDQVSSWSECACFEMGLLKEEDWKAFWIGQGDDFDGDKSAAPAFVGNFVLRKRETVRKEFLPIRICERWKAESVKSLPNGNYLVDMGKNSAGFVCLKLWDTRKYEGKKLSCILRKC